jgi:hypothetical protein
MSGLDLPFVPAARSAARLRLVAAGCALLAAVGALVGSFLNLFSGRLMVSGDQQASMSITSWGFTVQGADQFGAVPISGYPLVFAAVALFGAASMSGLAATAAATPGTTRAAAVVTVAGTAFLVGVVWSVGMDLASFVNSFQPVGAVDNVSVERSLGPALWFLLAAVVLALIAAVTALLAPRRRPVAASYAPSPYQADLTTPRHGFPVPVAFPAQDRPTPFMPPPMTPIVDATAPGTMSHPNLHPVAPPPPRPDLLPTPPPSSHPIDPTPPPPPIEPPAPSQSPDPSSPPDLSRPPNSGPPPNSGQQPGPEPSRPPESSQPPDPSRSQA